MREILFRGKVISADDDLNGKWIYGHLVVRPDHDDGSGKYFICESGHRFIRCLSKMPCTYEVDPETVGQYTGLTDKNGKRIFEGDILQVIGYNEVIDRCVVGYGIYDSFSHNAKTVGFYLYWKRDKEQRQKYANLAYWVEVREAICIGNVHDHPELIAEVQT